MRTFTRSAVTALVVALAGCGGSSPQGEIGVAPTPDELRRSGAGHRFFEIREPSGPVRGTMLTMHGGGWVDAPGSARRTELIPAAYYQSRGWRVVNIAYSGVPQQAHGRPNPRPMLGDVVAFYDQVRRAFPGPICAYGESAGGHLVAMLTVVRPSLTCAVLSAAPLDLRLVRAQTNEPGRVAVDNAFGRGTKTLGEWSPARLWKGRAPRTPLFAVVAGNDPVVPPDQVRAAGRVRDSETVVLRGREPEDPAGIAFVHSSVDATGHQRMLAAQDRWLDRLVPRTAAAAPSASPPADGRACDAAVEKAHWATAARDDRWQLLRSGRGWSQRAAPTPQMAATAGCSGDGRSQIEGLSVWAAPSGETVPQGAEAALLYRPARGRTLRALDVSLRGFLLRSEEWDVGLFASPRERGTPANRVAGCLSGRCKGMRLVHSRGGDLVVSSRRDANPDTRDDPPVQRFQLPAGTRRVAWRLMCVARAGCSLDNRGMRPRQRDPVGHPAILSLYRVVVR